MLIRKLPLRLLALTTTLSLGCDPAVELPQDASSSTTELPADTQTTSSAGGPATSPTSATSPPDPPATSTDPYEPTTGSSGSSGWNTSSTTDDGCGFLGCPFDVPHPIECDILAQDCPKGEKCAPWANDGGNAWNATRCVPVARDADLPGDPCAVEGSGVSGIDTCALGSMCWNVDPDTLQGECVAQCMGTWEALTCADPNATCHASAEGVVNLCFSPCDPVSQSDCDDGQGCYPSSESFICAADASGEQGQTFDECEFINACDPGGACVPSTLSEACAQDGAGCCLPLCDLGMPNCPGEMACTPWFEEGTAPAGSEVVGLCVGGLAAP